MDMARVHCTLPPGDCRLIMEIKFFDVMSDE